MGEYGKAIIIFISGVLVFTGCSTTMVVKPDAKDSPLPKEPILKGKIDYDKTNQKYLPTMIKEGNTKLTLKYRYEVKYNNGGVDNDGLNLFNPLLFVGFPLSESDLLVSGKLIVLKNGKAKEHFESSCVAKETRNLFNTGGSSEERKQCLLKVRHNIDIQILNKYKKRWKNENNI